MMSESAGWFTFKIVAWHDHDIELAEIRPEEDGERSPGIRVVMEYEC